MYIERVLDEINVLGVLNPEHFHPCTKEDVRALEENFHLSLPTAYKEFLLVMGKGAEGFLVGSDVFYQQLDDLQEVAEELLEENNFPEQLPQDAFVFFMHQGYQFNFFRTSEGEDPPVYRYHEGKDLESFALIYPHFTDFLLRELRDHAWYVRKRQEASEKKSENCMVSSYHLARNKPSE